jgi:predicted GH43/DUF377 family glycosyl hydrolase
MRKIFICFVFLSVCQLALFGNEDPKGIISSKNKIVTSSKRIYLPEYPGAFNPSIIKYDNNYLMTFRYLPNCSGTSWISYIGVVLLDDSFEPISTAQLLDTRFSSKQTPSQSEDARVFSYNGKYYLIYNDNMDKTFPSSWDRRDLYMAELLCNDDRFIIGYPLKLIHETKYNSVRWQKNWVPFEWNGILMLSYSINPHEVLYPNLDTGICQSLYSSQKKIQWNLGILRGSSSPTLVDGEYLGFFHSSTITTTPSSNYNHLWHYFMGAYTFSAEPPFEITKISAEPIDAPGFYTHSSYEKRVIYPGGYVQDGSNVYLAYGKDDCEIWIATINLDALKESMVTVSSE